MTESWQIRKDGRILCGSSVENCGYNAKQLESLKRCDYSLYHNGKCVMKGRKNSNYAERICG